MEKIAFDIETTGADISKDRIVQIALIIFDENWNVLNEKSKLINPEMHINEEATEIHGITDKMVNTLPTFDKYAKSINQLFLNREIIGYNILNFDLPILAAEFERCGLEPNFSDKIIDVYKIECNLFPRNLSAIYKKYTGYELSEAHDAYADVKATAAILQHQMANISNKEELYELSESKGLLDYTAKLAYNSKGEICFNFGKHKGKRIQDEPDYCNWILKSDFSNQVKNIIQKYI